MFKNYLKITFRNLIKHKIYSLINILGLSIGLTCSMLILIFMNHQFSYDRFHKKADRIYRLGREIAAAEGELRAPLSSAPVAKVLKQDYPEVVDVVRFKGMGKVILRYKNQQFTEKHIYFVDPSVFDVFTYPLIEGDPKTALSKPYTVVISQAMAEKYFGDDESIGKILKFNNKYDFMVTAVMKNAPKTTHRKIHMLCSFESLVAQNNPNLEDWLSFDYFTYLLLQKDTDHKTLEAKFPQLIKRYIGEDTKSLQGTLSFYLNPLKKIYLYTHLDGDSPGRITEAIYYSLLAFFLTLIACINFINLTTARSSVRAKEVGLRKVVGASRTKLVKQFLSEAISLSVLALFLAFLLVELLLPAFSNNVGVKLTLSVSQTPEIYIGFIILAFFIGLIAGIYPAFYLSRFQPTQTLKSNLIAKYKKSTMRSILVVVQFVLSIILICHTFILNNQINYLKNKEIGFHKKDVVVLPIMDERIKQSMQTFKKELLSHSYIVSVAATSSLPGLGIPRNVKIPEGYSKNEMQLMDDINVDVNFIPTLNIEMVMGRNFFETNKSDQQNAIIINQLAARKFGWIDPIGKTIQYSIGQNQFATGIVVGVVKDFHLSSMHRVIEPLFISNNPENLNHILIRVRPGKLSSTLDFIQEKWKTIYPNHPFQYDFLEDRYDIYFRTLDNVIEVLTFFAVLAILLACLGIFALAAFIAERRTKEIGIRKVLGDTTPGIVARLNFELLKYVFIAILFIIPYTYLTKDLLSMFLPYMKSVDYFIYLKATALVFVIALLSISYQSIKSALANPVEALRYE